MQLLGTMRHQVIILILVMPYIHGQEITTLPPPEPPTEPPTEPPPSVCPGGFFTPTGSKPCFRLVGEELGSWIDAKKKCSAEGLTMAQPSDESAVELRNHIATELDLSSPVWLGARGDGTGGQFQWLNGSTLPSNNKLWLVGAPGTRDTTDHCLTMAVAAWALASYPNKTYDSGSCSTDYRYTLCEEAPASTRATLETATANQIAPPKELRTSVCPEGFFSVEGSTQCFKVVDERLGSWTSAKRNCKKLGLTMAHPSEEVAVQLRNHMSTILATVPNLGTYPNVWLGARGTGEQFQWLDGTVLPDSHELWLDGAPGNRTTSNDCLMMWVSPWAVRDYQNITYGTENCREARFTLCEADKTVGHTEGNKLKRTIVRHRPVGRSRSESLTRYQRPARIGV